MLVLGPSNSWAGGGWYLVVAPGGLFLPTKQPELDSPLERWSNLGSFDSAASCEQTRTRWTEAQFNALSLLARDREDRETAKWHL
jgi:hypothetical protein